MQVHVPLFQICQLARSWRTVAERWFTRQTKTVVLTQRHVVGEYVLCRSVHSQPIWRVCGWVPRMKDEVRMTSPGANVELSHLTSSPIVARQRTLLRLLAKARSYKISALPLLFPPSTTLLLSILCFLQNHRLVHTVFVSSTARLRTHRTRTSRLTRRRHASSAPRVQGEDSKRKQVTRSRADSKHQFFGRTVGGCRRLLVQKQVRKSSRQLQACGIIGPSALSPS